MKKIILLFAMLLFNHWVFAQFVKIKGKVQDAESKVPLSGVSISIKNAKTLGVTNADGKFELDKVPTSSVLVFTMVGFETKEMKATDAQEMLVLLNNNISNLNEVVVLGYTSQKMKDVTGAVSVVSSKTISDLRPIKTEQALQGTVPGVTVTSQSGAPGAGLDIKIRGVSTNGNNGALVIIDGYQGDLSVLNPDDIESITVLKDAQAAIYGTIGANGVIVVTTKSGKKNTKTKFSYNGYAGIQQTTKKLSLLNEKEYALLLNESYANGGQALPFTNLTTLGAGTNWQNEVFRSAPIFSNELSVTGGGDKISYALSGSDLRQQGIIGAGKTGFRRNTGRLALNADLSPKLKLQSTLIYTNIDRKSINENGLGSVLFNALNAPPTLPVYDSNGAYTLIPNTPGYGIEIINPLAQIENTYNDYLLSKFNGNLKAEYQLFKDLNVTSRVGFNNSNSYGKSFAKQISYGGKVFDVARNSVSQNRINDNNVTFDFLLNYAKTFAEVHAVKATLGTTVYKEFGNGLFATGFDVPDNSWNNADLSLALGVSPNGGRDVSAYAYDERRLSQFLFVDYAFKDKYLVNINLRRDLSTKFGPENRVAFFPSVTSGWIVSKENFYNPSGFVNFLKIRASYGILGNDQIVNNGYVGNLNGVGSYVFDGQIVRGTAVGVLPNTSLKWEQAKKFDVGADLRLWKDKISITTDYFIDTRDNLLINNIPISGITGVYAPGSGSPTINAGAVRNQGLEFAVNYSEKLNKDLNIRLAYNFTTLQNKVLYVNNSTGFLEGGAFGVGQLAPVRMQAGLPIGYFYGLKAVGIFQNQAEIDASPVQDALGSKSNPGDIKFLDVNNDGKIDFNDRTQIGKPIADITMGFNFGVNYKNFDFSAYMFASIGNEMIRNYERTLSDVNKLNYVLNRWVGAGTSNEVPRVTTGATNNNLFSSFFVEDASFLRFQTVQLGYTFPEKWMKKVGVDKFRMYLSGNNLFTLTKYQGFDPAASNGAAVGGGIDYGFYPNPRVITFGINANF